MNSTLIELKNVSYKYENNLILNKVNLKINSGIFMKLFIIC